MKAVLTALAASAAFVIAAPAQAVVVDLGSQNVVMADDLAGGLTGSFGYTHTAGAGDFSRTFSFDLPSAGWTTASITTSWQHVSQNINFLSATLNGVALDLTSFGGGRFETGFVGDVASLAGTNNLVVTYQAIGNAGSLGGDVNFAPAVPEPSTWAMMILGFGVVGAGLRRRKQVAKVSFA